MTGLPRLPETTFPTCRAHYPGGSSGCACRLLPRSCSLPQMAGGSASALSLSRPAQASHMLRPAGSLSRLKRPLSRGSSPSGYPAEPLVSYRINRQLSGWNLPPQVIRAFGAHCQNLTHAPRQTSVRLNATAVGTLIAERPPHRTVRAAFPHTAPTLGNDGSTTRMQSNDWYTYAGAVSDARVALDCIPLGPRPSLH